MQDKSHSTQCENSSRDNFINSLCKEIKRKEVRQAIANEFEAHIDDLTTELVESGMSVEAATQEAVKRMGSPVEIGADLNKTYKPIIEWSLLIITPILVLGGTFILAFINGISDYKFAEQNYFWGSMAFGAVAFLIAFFMDYKKLEALCIPIFAVFFLVGILGQCRRVGNYISLDVFYGKNILIPIFLVIVMPLLIAFAGLIKWFATCSLNNSVLVTIIKGNKSYNLKMGKLFDFGFTVLISAFTFFILLIFPAISFTMLLGAAFLAMLTIGIIESKVLKNKFKYMLTLYGGAFAVLCLVLYKVVGSVGYLRDRLLFFLNPEAYATTGGYQTNMARTFLQASKLFGKVEVSFLGESRTVVQSVPMFFTDYIFTTIVATFGWFFAAALIALLLIFIWRIAASTLKISDIYGKILTIGICTVFAVQIVINVLVGLTLFPAVSIVLPFISYGQYSFIGNMFLVGLLLGIYRRKNLVVEVA